MNGEVARVVPQSMLSVGLPLASTMLIVSWSTGFGSFSTLRSARPRSLSSLYSVPHWPVCLLTTSFQLVGPGTV